MDRRYLVLMGALAAVIVSLALAHAPTSLPSFVGVAEAFGEGAQSPTAAKATAQKTWTPSRTPWGDPDIQGVWRYEAAIPLERPKELADKPFLTDEEVARRDQAEKEQEAKRLAGVDGVDVGRRPVTESPIRGNEYNSFWQDHGRPRQIYNRTSLIVDPPNGRIPYTPDALKAEGRSAARYGVGPYESFLDPDTGERCLTDGVTALMWQGPNGGHNRITQSPEYVTILHEEYRDRRIIPVSDAGRAHGSIRQWFGDAVGHWEGSTLEVDTINFLDKTHYEWANVWTRPSETLHLIERFTRVDADTIEYEITVEDPKTFSRPWKAVIPITRLPSETQIYEYACHEGNYAMPNLLSGARAQNNADEKGR